MADEDAFHDDTEGGGSGEVQNQQQPTIDLSPIEDRLNRITQAITGITRDQETREIRQRVDSVEQSIRQRTTQAENAVTIAERRVAEAYDSGDGATIARANRMMTEAIATRESVKAEAQEFARRKKQLDAQQQAPQRGDQVQDADEGAKDTRNLNDWKTRNSSWYGVDTDLTKAAHEVDRAIRTAGVIPVGSQEYFKAIDRQMAQKFPDRFRSTPSTAGADGQGNRQPAPRQQGRIPQNVIDSWGRMGIDVKDDKVLARMVRNQEALVSKGILPQERQYGTVITR